MREHNMAIQTKLVGTLTDNEREAIARARKVAESLVQNIGLLELRKSKAISDLQENEKKGQEVLRAVQERLGISNDTPWQVEPDGNVSIAVNAQSEGEV
jgi:hypothetical protein